MAKCKALAGPARLIKTISKMPKPGTSYNKQLSTFTSQIRTSGRKRLCLTPKQALLYTTTFHHHHPSSVRFLQPFCRTNTDPGANAQFTRNAVNIKLLQVWLLVNPCCYSPLEVVLEATAFSLTSVRLEHFTMEFSTFFFSVVVELWDCASMMTSHYFSSPCTNT